MRECESLCSYSRSPAAQQTKRPTLCLRHQIA
jgi:hypothetical protein